MNPNTEITEFTLSTNHFFHQASIEESQNNLDNAIFIYEDIINKEPDSILAYLKLGNIYIKLALYSKAFLLFQKALTIKRNSKILFKMGLLFYKQYQFSEAANFFLECITASPQFTEAHLYAGKSLSRLERYDKALFFLNNVLASDKNHIPALKEKLEVIYKLKDYRKTKVLAIQLIDLTPEDYLLYRYLGFSELFLGNFQKAEAAFEEAMYKNPFWSKNAAKWKQELKEKNFNFPKDKEKLDALENTFIQKGDHRSLGYLYFYRGKHQKAVQAFENAKMKTAN